MNYFKSEDRSTYIYGDAGKQLIITGINVREGSGQLVYKCELDRRRSLDLVHAAADWDMFCCQVFAAASFEGREKIGVADKLVQIDKSKIGKREYDRGHVV